MSPSDPAVHEAYKYGEGALSRVAAAHGLTEHVARLRIVAMALQIEREMRKAMAPGGSKPSNPRKALAIKMVRQGRSVDKAAEFAGVIPATVNSWVRKDRRERGLL